MTPTKLNPLTTVEAAKFSAGGGDDPGPLDIVGPIGRLEEAGETGMVVVEGDEAGVGACMEEGLALGARVLVEGDGAAVGLVLEGLALGAEEGVGLFLGDGLALGERVGVVAAATVTVSFWLRPQ